MAWDSSLTARPTFEDEEITPENAAALDRGEGIPHEEILRAFGLR